jgi:GNAT superfamily N-acetyltransferase
MDAEAVMQTNFWMLSIGEHPHGERTLPRFGCMRPDLAAMSLEYVPDLTVADRIRELVSAEQQAGPEPERNDWRKLFVRALSTIFRAWEHSGRRIVPGSIDPANVVVPETDWHEGAVLLSLTGWDAYQDTRSLFLPMVRTFYHKTAVLNPGSAKLLRLEWIFDACVEALGERAALPVLRQFEMEAGAAPGEVDPAVRQCLAAYLRDFVGCYHRPLALSNAIGRYAEWSRVNAMATPAARAQLLDQLQDLYQLGRFGETARYQLYRHTYFTTAPEETQTAFDRLLRALCADPERSATELVELSELQASLTTDGDRAVFARLVFPRGRMTQPLEVMIFGESEHKQVTVVTHFVDARGESYDLREPVEPEEIGQLYRLFFQERFPKAVSELDRYLVVTDAAGRVVGGLCYKLESADLAHLDGAVVNSAVGGRGIATALLEDFATRMASRGIQVLRTGFFMRRFCERRGYRIDRRWGGLVRFLAPAATMSADEGAD